MYNDDNMNRPRFDAKTGEPIYYDQDGKQVKNNDTTGDTSTQDYSTSQNENQSEYRYSQSEIPFGRSQETDGSQTGQDTDSWGEQNTYTDNQYYQDPFTTTQQDFNAATENTEKESKKHKKKKDKKHNMNFFKKRFVKLATSAVAFGLIAGIVMYGVYYAGVSIFPSSSSKTYEIATVSSNVSATSSVSSDSSDDGTVTMNIASVANAALPAMVALEGTETVTSSSSSLYGMIGGSQSYEATTSGTGIIVGENDTELLILTNAHVVDDVDNLTCVFVDGESVSATVKGSKSDKDIAVVAVDLSSIEDSTLGQIAIAQLGDSDSVSVGEQVVAIGNALGEGQSVTTGIISALNRTITIDSTDYTGLFMTDAAINAGNSGGALLNAAGEVIGINCAKTSEDGVEGMAYSIPVSNVKDLIDSLMTKETRTKVDSSKSSFLGISAVDITSSIASSYGYPEGVMIRSVSSGSAAENAGLAAYDIIVSFDDQKVSTMSGLQTLMQYYAAGETVSIGYYHLEGNQYVLKTVDVTLDKKSE